jgi:hypothetical protein
VQWRAAPGNRAFFHAICDPQGHSVSVT